MHLGEPRGDAENHALLLVARHVASRAGANVAESMPLIHAKLAHANLDIHAKVVFGVHVAPREVLAEHKLVNLFASFNFGDETTTRLGKLAEEALVPDCLVSVAAARALTGADADKDANLPAGPLVDHGLVESLGGGVKGADTVVVKAGLANRDGLEGEADGARGTASLPNFAVEIGRRFAARVVGSKDDGSGVAG